MSATVANLVMEYVEERAISTATHPPRWWYRYVDDSHACLKKDYVQEFHDHLNSVNANIQFTKEVEQGNRLSFLDTTTTRVRGCIQVSVHRKPTHTHKYLDYNSHHPSQHKRSVVNSLLHRAQEIPSTNAERSRERTHVIKVLRDNNYPPSFIRVASPITTPSAKIRVPTTLPAPTHRQRHLLLFSLMSEASLREFREYYVTTALKWVINLFVFCARVSQDQRTNHLPCSAEVLFTKSVAWIAISYTMDRLTEPCKQGYKNTKGPFGLETTIPKLRSTRTSLFIVWTSTMRQL